jgi:hypothetical protein
MVPPQIQEKKNVAVCIYIYIYIYIYILTGPLPILWCCGDVEDVKTNERERESESVESVH